MLDSLKRWIGAAKAEAHGWRDLADWAHSRQWTLRGVRDAEGFVIDGHAGSTAWRLEWGPSQRPYIQGNELRLRAELAVPRELQVLVLNRDLMEAMEKSVFEQYVEGVQTRIDTSTPPEMRWLVMFPKLSGSELNALRNGWGALASWKPWVQQWLGGSLAPALAALSTSVERPLVLMVSRQRLSMRTALAPVESMGLAAWITLFEAALAEAQRVSIELVDAASPSTQPSLFPASTLSAEGARR